MSSATISLPNADAVRALLGPQDSHLKRIRDALNVRLLLRGEQLSIEGEDEAVRRTLEVLEQLQEVIQREGHLIDEDLSRAVDGAQSRPATAEPIDVFEKAKQIAPRTPGQAEYVEAIRNHDLVFCRGPAGCGKTYLAVAMAVNALRKERVRKIVLVRPAVEAGEKLGFLPGDMLAKINPFLRPLLDALSDILSYEQVRRYMEADVVEILPLAFMRGRTLNDTFIILDEGQNTTVTQMKMFLTRMGEGSRIVVTGDVTQTDLPQHVPSGLSDAAQRLSGIDGVTVVDLTGRDIVRHRLVREIVRAYDDEGQRGRRRR
ncbi:MAG: PhoH family protein [Planctomycetaceae bacterium]|nr:PhoH family protein [Planctomycetaceae bacterium]